MELAETIFMVVLGLVLLGIVAVASYSIYNCVRLRARSLRSGYVPITNEPSSLFTRCRRPSMVTSHASNPSVYTPARVLVDSGGFPITTPVGRLTTPVGRYGSTARTPSSAPSCSRIIPVRPRYSSDDEPLQYSNFTPPKGRPNYKHSADAAQGTKSSKNKNKSTHTTVATIHVSENSTRDTFTPPTVCTSPGFGHSSLPSTSAEQEVRNSLFEYSCGASNIADYIEKNTGDEAPISIPPLPEGDIHTLIRNGRGFYSGNSGTFSNIQ